MEVMLIRFISDVYLISVVTSLEGLCLCRIESTLRFVNANLPRLAQ